jgi:hypothetical protein
MGSGLAKKKVESLVVQWLVHVHVLDVGKLHRTAAHLAVDAGCRTDCSQPTSQAPVVGAALTAFEDSTSQKKARGGAGLTIWRTVGSLYSIAAGFPYSFTGTNSCNETVMLPTQISKGVPKSSKRCS